MTHPFAVLEHPASLDKVEASLLRNDGSLILPRPRVSGGKPLMQALKERHTSREFARGQLPLQLLSDLLWAALGVNRTPNEAGLRLPRLTGRRSISMSPYGRAFICSTPSGTR